MADALDDTDRRILDKLLEDAGSSLAQIARELGLPRPTVNYRIQRMRKQGIIQRFTVLRDHAKLGRGLTSYVFVRYARDAGRSPRELAREVAKLPQVYEAHLLAGEWDLLLKVRTADLEELGTLVMEELRAMDGVGRTLTSSVLETVAERV